MRLVQCLKGVVFAVVVGSMSTAIMSAQKLSITGALSRVMAIGGESTGCSVRLDAEININGKAMRYIKVSDAQPGRLEGLNGERITATERIAYRHGVVTGVKPFPRTREKSLSSARSARMGHLRLPLRQGSWMAYSAASPSV